MVKFRTQYLYNGFYETFSLQDMLTLYQSNNKDAKLISVILYPRNPGSGETYKAIWEHTCEP